MALTKDDVVLAAREKFPNISTALDEGRLTSANVVEAMSERFPDIKSQLEPKEAQMSALEKRVSGDPRKEVEKFFGSGRGTTEEAGRILLGFTPVSPAVQGLSEFNRSRDEGRDFTDSMRKGLIAAGADALITILGGKTTQANR